ncbi:hypothetical protein [Oerskovia enterophila]|uniref:DUF2188 domain-containing protein n=1 Tax=Oerskovia enterophila TaxID=43678 RepID=A0ABX2YAW9_9CELL|nr:hypothetical protein [Oerskovia enterophila]OCI32874.1 hypothetical protein OERS_04660 [Oerskovia enterophila]
MTTTTDRSRVSAGTPSGGQFSTEPKTEPDVTLAAPAGPGLWVRIEREGQDLMVGPYPDDETANRAMQDSLLIDGFCEEDALDCYIDDGQPTDADDQVIVNLNDHHHTGRLEADEDAAETADPTDEQVPS